MLRFWAFGWGTGLFGMTLDFDLRGGRGFLVDRSFPDGRRFWVPVLRFSWMFGFLIWYPGFLISFNIDFGCLLSSRPARSSSSHDFDFYSFSFLPCVLCLDP